MSDKTLYDELIEYMEELEYRTQVENEAIELIVQGEYQKSIELLKTI